MILRIEVPYLETAVRRGLIFNWDKGENEQVEYGERLCSIAVDEKLSLRRDKRANVLARVPGLGDRAASLNRYVRRKPRGLILFELVASEPAVLRYILAQEGQRIETGEIVGIATTDPGEPVDRSAPPPDGAPSMRVVARIMETYSEEKT
jgi:hypothetical protein